MPIFGSHNNLRQFDMTELENDIHETLITLTSDIVAAHVSMIDEPRTTA